MAVIENNPDIPSTGVAKPSLESRGRRIKQQKYSCSSSSLLRDSAESVKMSSAYKVAVFQPSKEQHVGSLTSLSDSIAIIIIPMCLQRFLTSLPASIAITIIPRCLVSFVSLSPNITVIIVPRCLVYSAFSGTIYNKTLVLANIKK